jgi:hypothetical protein
LARGRIIWDEQVQLAAVTEGEIVLDYQADGSEAGFSLKCGTGKCGRE